MIRTLAVPDDYGDSALSCGMISCLLVLSGVVGLAVLRTLSIWLVLMFFNGLVLIRHRKCVVRMWIGNLVVLSWVPS